MPSETVLCFSIVIIIMGNRRCRAAAEGSFLELVKYRLERLESLIAELHWQQVGQWKMAPPQEARVITIADHIDFVATSRHADTNEEVFGISNSSSTSATIEAHKEQVTHLVAPREEVELKIEEFPDDEAGRKQEAYQSVPCSAKLEAEVRKAVKLNEEKVAADTEHLSEIHKCPVVKKPDHASGQTMWNSWLDPWDWLPTAAVSTQHFALAKQWADSHKLLDDDGGDEKVESCPDDGTPNISEDETAALPINSRSIIVSSMQELDFDDAVAYFGKFGPVSVDESRMCSLKRTPNAQWFIQWFVIFDKGDAAISALQSRVHKIRSKTHSCRGNYNRCRCRAQLMTAHCDRPSHGAMA